MKKLLIETWQKTFSKIKLLKKKHYIAIISIIALIGIIDLLHESHGEKADKIAIYLVKRSVTLPSWIDWYSAETLTSFAEGSEKERLSKKFIVETKKAKKNADEIYKTCIDYYIEELDDAVSPADNIAEEVFLKCAPIFLDSLAFNIKNIKGGIYANIAPVAIGKTAELALRKGASYKEFIPVQEAGSAPGFVVNKFFFEIEATTSQKEVYHSVLKAR